MELLQNASGVLELLILQGRALQLLEHVFRELEDLRALLNAMHPTTHQLQVQRQELAWLMEDLLRSLIALEAEHDRTVRDLQAIIAELDAATANDIAQWPRNE